MGGGGVQNATIQGSPGDSDRETRR
jgi:hypothetical protein